MFVQGWGNGVSAGPRRPSSGAGWQPGARPPSLLLHSAAKSRACHPLGTNKQETDTSLALAPLPGSSSLPTGPRPACLSLAPEAQDKGHQSQINQQNRVKRDSGQNVVTTEL